MCPIVFNTFSNDLEKEERNYPLTKFVGRSTLYVCVYKQSVHNEGTVARGPPEGPKEVGGIREQELHNE